MNYSKQNFLKILIWGSWIVCEMGHWQKYWLICSTVLPNNIVFCSARLYRYIWRNLRDFFLRLLTSLAVNKWRGSIWTNGTNLWYIYWNRDKLNKAHRGFLIIKLLHCDAVWLDRLWLCYQHMMQNAWEGICYMGCAGIIFGMRPANERRRCIVTSSLIGWTPTQNDPWVCVSGTSVIFTI